MATVAPDPNNPPDVVEQYLRSVMTPEGTTIRRNGKPIARVLPVNGSPPAEVPVTAPDLPWTEELNARRVDLINRKYKVGLTGAEEAELAGLKAVLRRHVDQVAPLPVEAARELHRELLAEADRASNDRGS